MNMTQVWEGDKVMAVTAVLAGPCVVTQIKDEANDGYVALQVGFDTRKAKNMAKPVKNHLAKSGHDNLKNLREFRVADIKDVKVGDVIKADTFVKGEEIDVVGISKGKGFQGVVKRHGFSGSKMTHGNKDQQRHSGSVGPKGPAHVFKGTKMGGHMGDDRVTIKNLEVIDIDLAKNIIYVKGGIPGAINSLVMIKGKGELKISSNEDVKPEVTEEVEVVAPVTIAEEKTEIVPETTEEKVEVEVAVEAPAETEKENTETKPAEEAQA